MANLDASDNADLASAWIELHKVAVGSDAHANLFWAYEKLDSLVRNAPNEAWLTIVEIAKLDDGDWTIENLGAGPLEDLLVLHGPQVIAQLESQMAEPLVARFVQHVWKNAMSDETWARLQTLAQRTKQNDSL